MSDMAIGGGIQNAQWTAALTGLAQSIGCGDVKLAGSMNDGKVTLTMTDNKTGVTASHTYTPELDPAQFSDDFDAVMTQTDAIRKISQFKAEFSNEETNDILETAEAAGEAGLVTEESTGYSKALFDIYSIIRLCKTTAQELKDTMRTAREADLQASLAQTHSEAAAQREAATKGLVWTCVIASVATIGTTVAGGLGIKQTSKAAKMRTSGELGRANKKLNTLLKGGNKELAGANMERKFNKLNATEKQDMEKLFGTPESIAPKSNAVKPKETGEASEMSQRGTATEERLNRFEGHQKALEKDTDEAWGALEKAKANPKTDKKDLKAAEDKYKSCLRKEEYGQSVVTQQKAELGKTNSISADIQETQIQFDTLAKATNNSAEILNLEKSGSRLNVASQSTMMMGNALGGVGGSIQAMYSANATEIEADVKEADARREEDNEVFSAAQQLVDEALSLAKSVNESLAQTNQNILA